jgi:sulfoxide reductase heme-binding subunit YedZ
LAAASTVVLAAGVSFLDGDLRTRTSLALAWAAMAGLTATLCLGPLTLLRGRPHPVSSDLRRDLGIWTAVLALVHTGVGLTVHFRGRMHLYFLAPPDQQIPGPIRLDLFGITNHLGLIAAILLAGLALISSDRWLARLGTTRWKRWQRTAYVAVILTVVHGLVFQFLERRAAGLVAGLALLILLIAVAQILGVREHRRRRGAVREP